MDNFVRGTLGDGAAERYQIIIDDPEKAVMAMNQGLLAVKRFRDDSIDSYYFNRNIKVPLDFQQPFFPSHEAVAALKLTQDSPPGRLAADIRRAMSAIVAGNVKPEGIKVVEEQGPYTIHGQQEIMDRLDELLKSFIAQGRMRLTGVYEPCYRIEAA